ncbi:hypothetical protein B1A99_09555 [Cohnella sp. CIP 111063]|jgi:hypothetical protein|uniref:DUF6933 domain-containing protein n=1 Tax=unclassified Cohnella TaxID=2636738 RepID=UPI000B8BBC85|nr:MULTISPECIES: hypothetical protein [unclassified Cohnella]OXS59779.1 hypothetical protein B1A99_09555 [Cohnella sp. CIP 111063]PRX72570.1 hypothetical protein B0G52_105123 [Cohnella sp. SGD-V74]
MLFIKATKDTLKDLNTTPVAVEATDLLYSWHVNIFTLYRKKHYVFMNDLSRLSLTISGIRSNQSAKLKDIFIDNLKQYLVTEQVPEHLLRYYIENCDEMVITKTDSRSVRSTLNEIMLVMKSLEYDKQGYEDLDQRHKWNNRFIYKPIDYKYPIDVFMNELEKKYKNKDN